MIFSLCTKEKDLERTPWEIISRVIIHCTELKPDNYHENGK